MAADPGRRSGEAELLAAAGRGDERSATVLYDTYADALYAYGLSHLHDRELAEELVQRVLEKLWRRAEAYDPARGPVRAYVFAIARSTAIDLQRRGARRPRPVGELADGVDTVTDAADQILTAASVRAALDRLTPDHRRVLELAYTRDLDQRAIAEVLRLPLGTVKSRTFYALKAFRLACDELGVTR
ncbi:RNA polymerase sigma factor [Nitriliruptor alkaliphilus]|uniref:RNA polymerase sigma factor n=1 Tax=Nitriliruptor alkaliphilus TaxID=427918 RepID=UPI000696BD3D|nr:sigma-70 family RNA polymerase sigma factor [Nitriliruptor alkaliphilus]